MADAALLFQRRLLGEPRPIDGAFAGVGIHGKVSDLEGREVLEEMTALRRSDPEIMEAGFDDRARAGDFVPLDGDPEPWVVRSPAADSDQQIGTIVSVSAALK